MVAWARVVLFLNQDLVDKHLFHLMPRSSKAVRLVAVKPGEAARWDVGVSILDRRWKSTFFSGRWSVAESELIADLATSVLLKS